MNVQTEFVNIVNPEDDNVLTVPPSELEEFNIAQPNQNQ